MAEEFAPLSYAQFREHLIANYRADPPVRWSTKNRFLQYHAPTALKEIGMEPGTRSLNEQLWAIVNGLSEWPKCPMCGEFNKFIGPEYRRDVVKTPCYTDYCSALCGTNSPTKKEKSCQTNLAKYGTDNPSKCPEIIEKIATTQKRKFGVRNYMQSPGVAAAVATKRMDHAYDDLNNKYPTLKPLFTREEYKGSFFGNEYKWACNECGHEFMVGLDIRREVKCPCCKLKGINSLETIIKDFLDEHNIQYDVKTKKVIPPKEIDFYIPSLNLGIEVHGLHHHSSYPRKDAAGNVRPYNSQRHLNKLKCCNEKGVRLIQIFEDEIVNKTDIVKSRLRNILKIKQPTVYARKCTIREIDTASKNKFLEQTHVQGADNSSVRVGLFDGDEMVALMTFCAPRFKQEDRHNFIELSRYSTVGDRYIIGGAGKLLAYYTKKYNPCKIVSYADLRWSVGDLYKQLGFTHKCNSSPNVWYTKGFKTRVHRRSFWKSDMEQKFSIFDNSKTQWQIAEDNGYYRIHDCGNMVFEKCITPK